MAANETSKSGRLVEGGANASKGCAKPFETRREKEALIDKASRWGALLLEREDPTGDLCVSQRQIRLDGAKLAPEWMPVQVYTLSCSLYVVPPGIDKQNILALRIDIIKVRSRHSHLPNCVITEQQPLPIIQLHQPAQQQRLR